MAKRIMIANKSFADRMVLKDYLLSFGYQIVGETKESKQTIEKYQELKPDLLIIDTSLSDMDGVSVIRELMREDYEANILICASMGQRGLAMEAMSAGARDFITKPFNPRMIKKTIDNLTRANNTF